MNASLKGPLLTLVTILMWASLPLILQQILPVISPRTVVACRFAAAALILGLFLRARKRLPDPRLLLQNRWLILIGILGLVGNFWLFSTSLLYLSAAASQVLAQISPFILLFAGIVVLKEPLRKNQIIGAAILMFGILLFFNRELPQIFAGGANHQMLGITLSLLGCFSWAAYGLVQKMLLRRLTAPQILFVFYCGCALFAAPFANWSELGNLNGYQWLCSTAVSTPPSPTAPLPKRLTIGKWAKSRPPSPWCRSLPLPLPRSPTGSSRQNSPHPTSTCSPPSAPP